MPRKPRVNVNVPVEIKIKLDVIKIRKRFSEMDEVVEFLIDLWEQRQGLKNVEYAIAGEYTELGGEIKCVPVLEELKMKVDLIRAYRQEAFVPNVFDLLLQNFEEMEPDWEY